MTGPLRLILFTLSNLTIDPDVMLTPRQADFCCSDPAEQAKLIVVIDTEEEFNWSLDFSCKNTSVKSMRSIEKIQGVFDEYQICFNMHEEPIVNSPTDAIRAFLQGNLDYLAIGDFLVRHPMQARSDGR